MTEIQAIQSGFAQNASDLCDFMAVQQTLFLPQFHAGNHHTVQLRQNPAKCYDYEHTVPRCLSATSQAARLSIFALPNYRPLASEYNRLKADLFERDGHDGQRVRFTLNFLYALTESVRECTEFDVCANLATLLERNTRVDSASSTAPTYVRRSLAVENLENGPPAGMSMLELLANDYDTAEELSSVLEEMVLSDFQQAPSISSLRSSLVEIRSEKASAEVSKLLELNAKGCELVAQRNQTAALVVPTNVIEFLRVCGLPTEWASRHAGKQHASVFSTPADQALKAALAQCLHEMAPTATPDYILRLDYNPLNSFNGLANLKKMNANLPFQMESYITVFETLLLSLDRTVYPWVQGSLAWLRSRYGQTKIDCYSANLIRRFFPYVRAHMLDNIVQRNEEIHESARMQSLLFCTVKRCLSLLQAIMFELTF